MKANGSTTTMAVAAAISGTPGRARRNRVAHLFRRLYINFRHVGEFTWASHKPRRILSQSRVFGCFGMYMKMYSKMEKARKGTDAWVCTKRDFSSSFFKSEDFAGILSRRSYGFGRPIIFVAPACSGRVFARIQSTHSQNTHTYAYNTNYVLRKDELCAWHVFVGIGVFFICLKIPWRGLRRDVWKACTLTLYWICEAAPNQLALPPKEDSRRLVELRIQERESGWYLTFPSHSDSFETCCRTLCYRVSWDSKVGILGVS